MMAFSGFFVCPSCKPLAVNKISRGDPVGTIWRDRKRLVMLRNGPFPDRCVRCNQPATEPGVKRTFYWHHPAVYLALFVPLSILLYIIIAMVVRKKSTVFVPLCPQHRKRRFMGLWICAGLFIFGVAGCIGSIAALNGDAAMAVGFACVAVVLGSVIAAAVISPILTARRMDEIYAHFTGAGPSFLAELPAWPRQ
jgi:hypothetical protein